MGHSAGWTRALIAALCLGSIAVGASAEDVAETPVDLDRAFEIARRNFAVAELEGVQGEILARAEAQPDSYAAQLAAADSFVTRATLLRNERFVRELPSELNASYRSQQAEWGEAGIPYAERALELADSDAERAQAERALGELYAHRISGMISGIINGPRARSHIQRALELDADDLECQRAIGLMYLHNPPISGGDVPKAIETFSRSTEQAPESDVYPVLLAMAHRKGGQPEQAGAAAREALRRNPHNRDAQRLLETLPEGTAGSE